MFENVNREDSVEEFIREPKLLLAIALNNVNIWEAFADSGTHVGPKLQSIVLLILARRKPFVKKMFSKASAEFQCAEEGGWSVLHRIGMIEPINEAKALRQDLMPIVYEVIAYGALGRGERRKHLRPFGNRRHFFH